MGQQLMIIANEEAAKGVFNKTVDVTELPAGVYFCKLETVNGVSTKYVVIQK